jgi:excisionase family DNA binding protein
MHSRDKDCHRVLHAAVMDNTPLLTTEQAAARLNVDVKALYWLNHKRQGPKRYKVGRGYRYKESDLAAWLESQAIEPAQAH